MGRRRDGHIEIEERRVHAAMRDVMTYHSEVSHVQLGRTWTKPIRSRSALALRQFRGLTGTRCSSGIRMGLPLPSADDARDSLAGLLVYVGRAVWYGIDGITRSVGVW